MLSDEVERRDSKQLDLRLKRASFEHKKSLEDFDFAFNSAVPKAKVIGLATCSFMGRREVVLLLGPTGVGKSHIAQALGHRACMAGFTVLYVPGHEMLTALRAARADESFDRKVLRYTTPDRLIIDDIGLPPLKGDEPHDFYEVIRHRYETGAIVLTSNRAIDD